jgi:2-polyprenyl-3-methyl-5-hydroxy-6-metoxy-1,4-benzoquinol methylase
MNKSSYNKIAREWSNKRKESFVSSLVIDFANKTKPKGHVLDVGCGTGLPLAKYLSDRGFFVKE